MNRTVIKKFGTGGFILELSPFNTAINYEDINQFFSSRDDVVFDAGSCLPVVFNDLPKIPLPML